MENLIFSVLRDPPGGGSTATLVEGSTISTSMAIEGAHAATLGESGNWGGSGGIQGGIKIEAAPMGFGAIWNGIGFGTTHGRDNSKSTSVTVDRGSSKHFDIGITFDIAITTSDSPYLAGQPSDVIIGGGINLRFLSAIEVYRQARPRGTSSASPENRLSSSYPKDYDLRHVGLRDREDDRAFGQGESGMQPRGTWLSRARA